MATKTKKTLDIKTVDTPSDLVAVNDQPVQVEVLSSQEKIALDYHENVIEKGLETFIEVGQSLQYIRDKRLYRANFNNFDEYMSERWGKTRAWASNMIKSVDVMKSLEKVSTRVDSLPESEAQLRPLAKLKDNPELMAEVWEEAVAEAKRQYEAGLKKTDQPTHKEVDAKVKEYEKKIEELKNKQTSLLNELNEKEKTIDNQTKNIQELNSSISEKENQLKEIADKQKDLEQKEQDLNRHIEVKANEKIEEKQKEIDKEKAKLKAKEEEIKKKLQEAEKIKTQIERDQERLNDANQWVTAFGLTNNFLVKTVASLREHRNNLERTPDLSELSEADQVKFKAKIQDLVVEFNTALHELGGQINYLNGAVAKFNNHALRVIDAEVENE